MKNSGKMISTVGLLISIFTISVHADVKAATDIQMLPPTSASGTTTVCGTGTNNLLTMAANGTGGTSAINCVAGARLDPSGNMQLPGTFMANGVLSAPAGINVNNAGILYPDGRATFTSDIFTNGSLSVHGHVITNSSTNALVLDAGPWTTAAGTLPGIDFRADDVLGNPGVGATGYKSLMYARSDGNVGIGTIAPIGNLDVENGHNSATFCLNGQCSSSIASLATSFWLPPTTRTNYPNPYTGNYSCPAGTVDEVLVTLWYGYAGNGSWVPLHICRPPANNSTSQSTGATSGGSGTGGMISTPPTCTGSNVLQFDGTNYNCVSASSLGISGGSRGASCSYSSITALIPQGVNYVYPSQYDNNSLPDGYAASYGFVTSCGSTGYSVQCQNGTPVPIAAAPALPQDNSGCSQGPG